MNSLKHFLAFAIASLLYVMPVSAQVGEARSDLAIGINGGMNWSSVTFTPTIKTAYLMGMCGGLSIRYTCEKYFTAICAVQMEINYVQRGWEEVIEDGSNNTYQRVTNYLEVPFMFNMGWGREQRGVRFFINAGPQMNFFLGEEETYGGDPWDPSHRPNNVTGQYGKATENKFDYGICGGGGLDWSTGIGHFVLEGRYYYGLADIFGNTKRDYFGRSGNSSITVKLSYLFDIIKTKK